jgi:hypothetical protein
MSFLHIYSKKKKKNASITGCIASGHMSLLCTGENHHYYGFDCLSSKLKSSFEAFKGVVV